MTRALPFTPTTLAVRWQCSERHIRNLIASGELPSFRLGGKLLRIRAEDVEAFECQTGGSPDSGDSSPSPLSKTDGAADSRSEPAMRARLSVLRQPSMQS
jgi:excisionase family DNA binding protein